MFGVTNNISLVPPSFPLLTQPEQITDVQQQFCNETNLPPKCANRTHCFCTHLLKVDLNDIVEIVLYDTAPCKWFYSSKQALYVDDPLIWKIPFGQMRKIFTTHSTSTDTGSSSPTWAACPSLDCTSDFSG